MTASCDASLSVSEGVHTLFQQVFERGHQHVFAPTDPQPTPDGRHIAFTAISLEADEAAGRQQVYLAEVGSGSWRSVASGPYNQRMARWSPDGRWLAFLSDQQTPGRFHLEVLTYDGAPSSFTVPSLDGTIESLSWSPDSRKLLLGVAGIGADLSTAQGSGVANSEAIPVDQPYVDDGLQDSQWRRLWRYDLATQRLTLIERPLLNIWEATWVGPDHIAALVSDSPGEDAWYTARLLLLGDSPAADRLLYTSSRQLGHLTGSPGGRWLAVIEAACSDRGVIAGQTLLVNLHSDLQQGRTALPLNTARVECSCLTWLSDTTLFVGGIRASESVFGVYRLASESDTATPAPRTHRLRRTQLPRPGGFHEWWITPETSGDFYPHAAPIASSEEQGFVLLLESYTRFPELTLIRQGAVHWSLPLAHAGVSALQQAAGRLAPVTWRARDRSTMHGYLITPETGGPHAMIVSVHGGPIACSRNRWAMGSPLTPFIVSQGYAVFYPNPRGSGGRGNAFAEEVYGDMGGKDAQDILAGIETLIRQGVADPHRIGIMGGSYGGFMACWLPTQSPRFAAAIAISPVTDWISQRYTSNIPYFDQRFLAERQITATSRYVTRSPIWASQHARTPTLLVAGQHDRATPPTQALEFHRALQQRGIASQLVIYPHEGHGIQRPSAQMDLGSRIISWFEHYMPATLPSERGTAIQGHRR